MNLRELIQRSNTPIPWAEGDNIPWDDEGFSARMLAEHLSQAHDAASRRTALIERHVAWIHGTLLGEAPAAILDLGCGPGLYTSRLARLGHACTGIDYSPASIAYAQQYAQAEKLACTYRREDIRKAAYGDGYGLVMLIFGEFNVFRPKDAHLILRKAHAALAPGGQLLLEPHTASGVQRMGEKPASWYTTDCGLFSDRPHLCLKENFWDAATHTATMRYYIVAADGEITRYAQTVQGYTADEYGNLLRECGFDDVTLLPSLGGDAGTPGDSMMVVSARRAA